MPTQRIISVVPSQTELLFELGLDEEIVGLTKFCIYPAEKVKPKTVVGGTKTLNMNRIHALKPDFILANKEENTREQIEELQQLYPVLVTDINTVSEALAMIRAVGERVGKKRPAEVLAKQIEERFLEGGFQIRNSMASDSKTASGPTVAYLIWRKPYMVAARQTFIHSMLKTTGFQNAFVEASRYPMVTEMELHDAQPALIFLSSEPYPFSEKHQAELRQICPKARVVLVDGEVFSWYGSRMLKAPAYIRQLRAALGLQ